MAASGSLCPPFDFSGKYYDVVSGDGGSGCGRQSSFFEGKAVLNQSVGYSVILGFGAFFAVFTSFLVCMASPHLTFVGVDFRVKKIIIPPKFYVLHLLFSIPSPEKH